MENKASEVVDVNLNTALLGLAAKFLDDKNPDDAAVKQLVAGLTGIYVRSFTFDGDFDYPKADIDGLRKQSLRQAGRLGKSAAARNRRTWTSISHWTETK